MTPLGIRNNNPFNIRYNSLNRWKGQIGQYKGFCSFSSMDYGIRSGLQILRVYRYHYNLDTIRKIISRFAPCNENDTDAYINYVVSFCKENGLDVLADTPLFLDFYDYKGVCPLFYIASAICQIECGYVLSSEQFSRCLKMLHVS